MGRKVGGIMPLYDYECGVCGTAVTKLRTVDTRRTDAPDCQACKKKMELAISVSTFVMDPAVSVKPLRRG